MLTKSAAPLKKLACISPHKLLMIAPHVAPRTPAPAVDNHAHHKALNQFLAVSFKELM